MVSQESCLDNQGPNSRRPARQGGREVAEGIPKRLRISEPEDHLLLLIKQVRSTLPILPLNQMQEPLPEGLRTVAAPVEPCQGEVGLALVSWAGSR